MDYFFYGDFGRQPNFVSNPFGTSINHFICYICISLLGLLLYLRSKNFNKIVSGLLFLSITLEVSHLIVPNRSFELNDLIGNILGVLVAYFLVKIYLHFSKT